MFLNRRVKYVMKSITRVRPIVLLGGVLLVCVALLALSSSASAQSGTSSDSVTLKVRTLAASGKLSVGEALSLKAKVEDLRPQLEELPFKKYRVLTTRVVTFPKKKKTTVPLRDDERLDLRMHYWKDGRMGLWLHWWGRKGEELLNTRMPLSSEVPIVVGADEHQPDRAKVLAVTLVDDEQ